MLRQENTTSTNSQREVRVCCGSGCPGADRILEHLEEEVSRLGLDVKVKSTGCHGFCQVGPTMIVEPEGVFYCRLSAEDVPEIVRNHLRDSKIVSR